MSSKDTPRMDAASSNFIKILYEKRCWGQLCSPQSVPSNHRWDKFLWDVLLQFWWMYVNRCYNSRIEGEITERRGTWPSIEPLPQEERGEERGEERENQRDQERRR